MLNTAIMDADAMDGAKSVLDDTAAHHTSMHASTQSIYMLAQIIQW